MRRATLKKQAPTEPSSQIRGMLGKPRAQTKVSSAKVARTFSLQPTCTQKRTELAAALANVQSKPQEMW